MSSTKRFAEPILKALNDEQEHIRFCMEDFGIMLQSSGSVVPVFLSENPQWRPGHATHPEIIRYFMMPEAARDPSERHGEGRDVFVLNNI